jgi:hypothetical protein
VNLVDAVKMHLDRILHRADVDRRGVERCERGVERGRLAAPGRSGRQHQAVGSRESVPEQRQRLVVQTEGVQPPVEPRAVEQP